MSGVCSRHLFSHWPAAISLWAVISPAKRGQPSSALGRM